VTRIAYVDCIGGVAGDMLLAALVDAGAPPDRLSDVASELGLDDVAIDVRRVERQGVGALQVRVRDEADYRGDSGRPYTDLRDRVARAELPPRARERSLNALKRLAEIEGAIHGVAPDDVHFHELGGVDTLIDVCGVMTLLDELNVERVACSPLPYSRGLVRAAHGVLPVPAPATLALLVGAPLVGVETSGELVTPTGAAIVSTVADAWGLLPPLTLENVGYGAGSREIDDRPNLVRVVLGSAPAARDGDVVLLETNLDDLNPELVPDAVERCLAAGALDVWTVPVNMKKGRPGVVFSALARPRDQAAVARAVFEETSALGVRFVEMKRYELEREERTVDLDGGTVRVKIGRLDGRVVNVAPEHDDCAALARSVGRSVKSVWVAALAAAEKP
jgi:uncharacterized protein (TIGR00299 family) protein